MQLIRNIVLCLAATICLPVILIAYELPTAAPEQVWISPNDGIAVVALTQHIPFSNRAEQALKPIIYKAISDNN